MSHELEKQKDKVSTTRKGEEGFGQMEKKRGGVRCLEWREESKGEKRRVYKKSWETP